MASGRPTSGGSLVTATRGGVETVTSFNLLNYIIKIKFGGASLKIWVVECSNETMIKW